MALWKCVIIMMAMLLRVTWCDGVSHHDAGLSCHRVAFLVYTTAKLLAYIDNNCELAMELIFLPKHFDVHPQTVNCASVYWHGVTSVVE